ncbi:MAG: hypothetical protein JRN06_03095 [Nitrososphaerota archaeon]|nr:hypothetical protein [Nitrososphaerota archaeon]MDG7023155.1 hypothetical protein [Nitrososphaerota archaeon]
MIAKAKSSFPGRSAKTILVLLFLASAIAASATVYTFFYTNATGTVRAPDVTLAAGTDNSGTCSAYPCATVSISGTSDTATVTLSLFKADAAFSPPPSTYYTNLVQIKDANNAHSIQSISITNVACSNAGGCSVDLGSVTVYYCTAQCTFDSNGGVSGGTQVGHYTFTSAASGSIGGTFPVSIAASATQYVEVVAYAGSGATAGDTVSFKVAMQWV